MENRIKEAQQDLFADRTSTGWMASNQLRLWFSAFAHLMLSVPRAEVLRGTDLASATLGQIRLKLFKLGARIKISCRRIHLELASAYPYQETFRRACANLSQCRRAEVQRALVDTTKPAGFSQRGTLLTNSYRRGKKTKQPRPSIPTRPDKAR